VRSEKKNVKKNTLKALDLFSEPLLVSLHTELAMKTTSPTSLLLLIALAVAIVTTVAQAQRPSRGGGTITPPPQPIAVPDISPR